jgi:hypothetical protein
MQPNGEAAGPKGTQSGTNTVGVACEAKVVQIGINQLQTPEGTRGTQFSQDRLQGEGKQEGAQRIALLNATLRRELVFAKE